MADLTTAVGELLKKKNTEENLHIYVEGLCFNYLGKTIKRVEFMKWIIFLV